MSSLSVKFQSVNGRFSNLILKLLTFFKGIVHPKINELISINYSPSCCSKHIIHSFIFGTQIMIFYMKSKFLVCGWSIPLNEQSSPIVQLWIKEFPWFIQLFELSHFFFIQTNSRAIPLLSDRFMNLLNWLWCTWKFHSKVTLCRQVLI